MAGAFGGAARWFQVFFCLVFGLMVKGFQQIDFFRCWWVLEVFLVVPERFRVNRAICAVVFVSIINLFNS